jgi:hypothetical protein
VSEGATERSEITGPASDLAALAPVHGQVLALRDAGLSAAAIAAIVGVAVESVPVLIEVAARKRANQVHIPNPKETTR